MRWRRPYVYTLHDLVRHALAPTGMRFDALHSSPHLIDLIRTQRTSLMTAASSCAFPPNKSNSPGAGSLLTLLTPSLPLRRSYSPPPPKADKGSRRVAVLTTEASRALGLAAGTGQRGRKPTTIWASRRRPKIRRIVICRRGEAG